MGADAWKPRTVAPELASTYVRDGLWDDASLGELLARGLSAHSSLAFVSRSEVHPWRGSLAEVYRLARRVAHGLQSMGIHEGDAVAFQLPNWAEAAVTFYGVTLLGAVVVPIVHFYGPREVGHILRQSGARVHISCDRFGHLDHLAMLAELRENLPELEHLVIVTTDGTPAPALPSWAVPFSRLCDASPVAGPVPVDPSAPALVAYTSGTTASPKGVIHSHRTIGAEVRQLAATQATGALPTLYGAPVGHGIGMLGGLLIPVERGQPIHLIDVWDPGKVLAAMEVEQLASGSGATFFLTSLLDHPDCGPAHHALMRHVGLGGSTIPRAVAERATALGLSLVRMYGSTEHPSITGGTHDDPLAKRIGTDGRPLPGCELRVVDDGGSPVPPGVAGEILSRGPDCFIGYTDPTLTDAVIDAGGWYHTEDIGALDEDGYLTITDRRKDIIIRGGENISALEVEELLLELDGIAEVAVVSAPDPRLGEHACAVLRLAPEAPCPELGAVRQHLERSGLARQHWPEELRVVEEFPRTASGKVQKFVLRQRLRDGW